MVLAESQKAFIAGMSCVVRPLQALGILRSAEHMLAAGLGRGCPLEVERGLGRRLGQSHVARGHGGSHQGAVQADKG